MKITMDIYAEIRKRYFLYYKGIRFIVLMRIIVVSFLYHICPKKAIAQIVSKIKSADRTNVLVLHRQYCCNSKR